MLGAFVGMCRWPTVAAVAVEGRLVSPKGCCCLPMGAVYEGRGLWPVAAAYKEDLVLLGSGDVRLLCFLWGRWPLRSRLGTWNQGELGSFCFLPGGS